MNMLEYNIVNSGPDGNCLIFNKYMAIDMGITFKKLIPYLKELGVEIISEEDFCKKYIN